MTQSKVLLFTLVVTIGTTLAEVLAEIGRNRLATDLFDIQGAAATVGRRRSRQTSVHNSNRVAVVAEVRQALPSGEIRPRPRSVATRRNRYAARSAATC